MGSRSDRKSRASNGTLGAPVIVGGSTVVPGVLVAVIVATIYCASNVGQVSGLSLHIAAR